MRRGAPVYLDYDQASLDAAYDQRVWASNIEAVQARLAARSEEARRTFGTPGLHRYGPTEVETLEWFRPEHSGAPVAVYIHGGGWRGGSAAASACVAHSLVGAGAHLVIPDFANVQDVGGSLLPLAEQVRRAVAWTLRHASSFGADPDRVFVIGTSSGGHLAAVALTTDWTGEWELARDAVKGGLCASGMYDLRPVALSSRSEYVAFTPAMVEELSPIDRVAWLQGDTVVAVGSRESPEFRRQGQAFATRIERAGKACRFLLAEGVNHYEIVETLCDPEGLLGRAALRLLGLSGRAG